MKCQNCGKEIENGSSFCIYCGTKVVPTITCPHCNTPIPEGDVFCMGCGWKVDKTEISRILEEKESIRIAREKEETVQREIMQKRETKRKKKLILISVLFLFIVTLIYGFFFEENTSSTQIAEDGIASEKVQDMTKDYSDEIIAFLRNLHTDSDMTQQIAENWWVHKYCTERMQKKLMDEYPYDIEPGQECYASWIIGGWDSESNGIYKDITYDADYFYVHLSADPGSPWKGSRVLRYKMIFDVENKVPKIDECEWIEDFEWSTDN